MTGQAPTVSMREHHEWKETFRYFSISRGIHSRDAHPHRHQQEHADQRATNPFHFAADR